MPNLRSPLAFDVVNSSAEHSSMIRRKPVTSGFLPFVLCISAETVATCQPTPTSLCQLETSSSCLLAVVLAGRQTDHTGGVVVFEDFTVSTPCNHGAQHTLGFGLVEVFAQKAQERLVR